MKPRTHHGDTFKCDGCPNTKALKLGSKWRLVLGGRIHMCSQCAKQRDGGKA